MRDDTSSVRIRAKAITICQPFAHMIATGEKLIENRTWSTRYRGPLVIHAGKSRSWLNGEDTNGMAFGALVAVAELVDSVAMDAPKWRREWASLASHEHRHGPWCWILSNVRRIEPLPQRGAQGLFNVDIEARYLDAPPVEPAPRETKTGPRYQCLFCKAETDAGGEGWIAPRELGRAHGFRFYRCAGHRHYHASRAIPIVLKMYRELEQCSAARSK